MVAVKENGRALQFADESLKKIKKLLKLLLKNMEEHFNTQIPLYKKIRILKHFYRLKMYEI